MDKHDNPFEILGVEPNADESTIKKVYFKLARQYHPDKQETEEDKQEMGSKFAKISDAYDLLTDPVRMQAWEQKKEQREARQRSRSPKAMPQRKHSSGKRSPPSSPGALNRPKQHPIVHNMPKRSYSPTRSPPRNIRPTKRSVSPVPTRNGSTNSQQQRQKPSRKLSTSPMRQRSTGTRRTGSPMPPRHPSPGKYQQSSVRHASPGTLRRKQYYNPSSSFQTPEASSSVPKPQGARRASSGGPIHTQPMANIFASHEEDPEKPRSCPRASWSSTRSINIEDLKKETTKKHPFEALGLHPFEVLGLPPTADKVEILTAYRALSFEYRPTNRSNSTGIEKQEAARQMARVTWAYEELKDPEKLQEWQQKVSNSKATIHHESHSESKFHDSVSSTKSWGLFRNHRDKAATSADEDSDDDNDSFIGDDAQKLKSTLNSPNNSIRSRGRNKLSGRRTTERSTSPKNGITKKVALLSSLGFPKRRSVSPKPADGGKRRSSLFSSLTSNKNASPVKEEEQVPTKIVTDEAPTTKETDQPVKKLKKKKKKKKSVTDTSSGDGEVDKDPITGKKLKKKRKKKKRPKSPTNNASDGHGPVDFTWKREESKMVIVAPEGSRSNRTATTFAEEDPAVVMVAH